MIYHLTTAQEWSESGHEKNFFPADSLAEGFIHCCTASQIAGVKERYFKGKKELILLHLKEENLIAELKYETSTNEEKFPHLYGPINRDAIFKIELLSLD